jgi:NADPH:quinone reductase-like Zn-dependent oxidoreductase
MSAPTPIPTIIHDKTTHSLSLQDYAVPVPTSNQYLIEVHSTTFTAGELDWPEPNALVDPIPGFDLSGTVITTPSNLPKSGVQYYAPGTRVYGLTSFARHGNARAVTVAEHNELSIIPEVLDFNTAASMPLSALTAWQALFDHAGLVPREGANAGKHLLVTAASGGVGIWLTQLAAWSGVHVTGTCSSSNSAMVKLLGAKEVLNYANTNLSEWVIKKNSDRQFDIVIDCVGGKTLEQAWRVVRDVGVLTSITTAVKPNPERPAGIGKDNVKAFWFIVEPNGSQLAAIATLVAEEKIRPQIDSVWKLSAYQEAWQKVKSGHVSGKVVLQVHTP